MKVRGLGLFELAFGALCLGLSAMAATTSSTTAITTTTKAVLLPPERPIEWWHAVIIVIAVTVGIFLMSGLWELTGMPKKYAGAPPPREEAFGAAVPVAEPPPARPVPPPVAEIPPPAKAAPAPVVPAAAVLVPESPPPEVPVAPEISEATPISPTTLTELQAQHPAPTAETGHPAPAAGTAQGGDEGSQITDIGRGGVQEIKEKFEPGS